MSILELLSHGFILRAIIAGSFIAILCSTLGVFLVLKRLSLIGDGLAHVAFGSVAMALFLGIYPLYVLIPMVMGGSIIILRLMEKARLYGDAAIGLVSSLGIAGGVLLANMAGGFNIDLFSYLFGSILSITYLEVIISLVLSVILISGILIFYPQLFATTFDEEAAQTAGINTKRINATLILMAGLTVALAIRMVGVMLVSALLIIPSITALQMAKGFKLTLIISGMVGFISVVLGIVIAYNADMPPGATIVMVSFFLFFIAFAYKRTFG